MTTDDRVATFMEQFQDAQSRSKTSKEGSSGSGAPPWVRRREQIKLTQEPTDVWLFEGDYSGVPFYESWAAWFTREGHPKQVICTCHGRKLKKPCLLCYLRDAEDNNNLAPKPRVAINAIELAYFHLVEKTSDKGAKWTEYERCAGTDELGRNLCKYCDAGVPRIFGKKGFLNLGKGYWNNFLGVIAKARLVCKSCGEGRLYVMRYLCADCGEVFLDLNKSTVSKEQRQDMETKAMTCPVCVHKGVAKKELSCFHRSPDGKLIKGCGAAKPATVFDFPLRLRVQGEGASSTLLCVNEDNLSPQAIPEAVKKLMEPYDFASFLSVMSLEEQAKLLGVKEIPKELLSGEKDEGPSTINYE